MMMYLLLRNNKQSGPYSLDELKTLGLKAYDLVWVDGKSAAWRYPCEVEELSAFAPAVEEQPLSAFAPSVEEQPFDLFYKKTSSSAKQTAATVSSRQETEKENTTPAAASSNVYAGEPSAVPGKRIIYVTMPAGKGQVVIRESVARESSRNISPVPLAVSQPADPLPAAPAGTVNASLDGVKLSQVKEDWKNAVEITPPVKRRRTSGFLQPLAVVICILALLAAGIFIGMSINKETFGFRQKIASRDASTGNGQTTSATPVTHTPAPPVSLVQTQSSPIQTQPSSTEKSLTTILPASKPPRQTPPKEKALSGNTRNQAASPVVVTRDSTALGIPVVHREAVHRADLPADKNDNEDKDVVKNNIANLVSVGTSGYTVGTFGGISGLQLTVSNHSVYPLDLVVVEVQYIQANKKIFKTENLYFRGIGPGSALMQEAPKSTRGIKVQYKITLVNSKELGLSYSGI
jgi:hypothetical protein